MNLGLPTHYTSHKFANVNLEYFLRLGDGPGDDSGAYDDEEDDGRHHVVSRSWDDTLVAVSRRDDYEHRGVEVAGRALGRVPPIAFFELGEKHTNARVAQPSKKTLVPGRPGSSWTEAEDGKLSDATDPYSEKDLKAAATWEPIAALVRSVTDEERGGADQPGRSAAACKARWRTAHPDDGDQDPAKGSTPGPYDEKHPQFETHQLRLYARRAEVLDARRPSASGTIAPASSASHRIGNIRCCRRSSTTVSSSSFAHTCPR